MEKIRKNTKQTLVINIAIGLVGSVLYKTILGVLLVVLAVVYFLLVVNPKLNQYKLLFKSNIVKASLEGIFSELNYDSTSGIDIEEVKTSELIDLKNEYVSNDLISAKYGSVKFRQADIMIKETSNHMSEKGELHQHTNEGFIGRLLIFDYLRRTEAIVRVVGKHYKSGGESQGILKSIKDKVGNLITDKLVLLESEVFNRNFSTFSTDEKSAFYVLTPQMIDAITMLSEHYKGKIAFSFINEKMYVSISTKQDSLESKVLSNRTIWHEKDLVLKDIKVITDFIERMKLEQNTLVATTE